MAGDVHAHVVGVVQNADCDCVWARGMGPLGGPGFLLMSGQGLNTCMLFVTDVASQSED